MEDVIAPISKELLKAGLTEEKRLRMTNRSHNQIYIITAQDSPNTMKEIGRLRESAFRAAGGGMVPLFWQLPICLTFRISF